MEAALHSGYKPDKEKLMAHIEQCSACKRQYDEIHREQKLWEHALYSDELHSTFTDDVMQRIDQLDHPKSVSMGLKKMRSSLFKLKVVSALLAVIVMVLAISIFVQPSLAEQIRSMFTKSVDSDFNVVDSGLRSAFNQGYVTPADYVAQNGDYTLEVKEVYADPLRIRMSVLLRDKNGDEVKNHALNLVSVEVWDNNGHIVPSTSYDMGREKSESLSYYGATFLEPVITDGLSIRMVLDDLYTLNKNQNIGKEFIPGEWEINYAADIRKTKSQTVLIPLTEQITTASGLHIKMNGIAYSPSGFGVSLATSLTKEAQQRSPGDLWQLQSIYYHYEKNGEPWDGYSSGLTNGNFSSGYINGYGSNSFNVWDQTMEWYSFETGINVTNQKDDIKFVFDGYSIVEQSDEAITFNPSEVSVSNPAVFNSLGDSFKITGMEFKDRGTSGHKEMLIDISDGSFTNLMGKDQWEIVDENGKVYQVILAPMEEEGSALYGKLSYMTWGYIFVDNLTQVPKQVTLRRTLVTRFYKDVNWSFMLPKEGTMLESNVINRDY